MVRWNLVTVAALLAAAGCNEQQPQQDNNGSLLIPKEANPPAPPPPSPHPPSPSLAEPRGAIDPTSAEAAAQVVQHYGALIEQRRWTEGWTLWTDAANFKSFEGNFRTWSDVHLEIGAPGDMEGAAGSIYVTVPANFYGHLRTGQQARLNASASLRRVNDVPGSTAEQRRWHIERIDPAGAP